jgi:hypothetical protein
MPQGNTAQVQSEALESRRTLMGNLLLEKVEHRIERST